MNHKKRIKLANTIYDIEKIEQLKEKIFKVVDRLDYDEIPAPENMETITVGLNILFGNVINTLVLELEELGFTDREEANKKAKIIDEIDILDELHEYTVSSLDEQLKLLDTTISHYGSLIEDLDIVFNKHTNLLEKELKK